MYCTKQSEMLNPRPVVHSFALAVSHERMDVYPTHEYDNTPPYQGFAKTQSQRDTRDGHKLLLDHKMIDRGRWTGGLLLYTYSGWASAQVDTGRLFESYDGSERC